MAQLYLVQYNEILGTLQPKERTIMLILRLITLALIVSLLTMHMRSLRVFRWEQSVTGGVLVTYTIAVLGLALCAGSADCGGQAFQAYACGSGAALFALNAAMLWRRWRTAGELTRIVAELLISLGLQLKWQLRWKMIMSALVAVLLLLDMAMNPLLPHSRDILLPSSPSVRAMTPNSTAR